MKIKAEDKVFCLRTGLVGIVAPGYPTNEGERFVQYSNYSTYEYESDLVLEEIWNSPLAKALREV
jgi:hypothetical protein